MVVDLSRRIEIASTEEGDGSVERERERRKRRSRSVGYKKPDYVAPDTWDAWMTGDTSSLPKKPPGCDR